MKLGDSGTKKERWRWLGLSRNVREDRDKSSNIKGCVDRALNVGRHISFGTRTASIYIAAKTKLENEAGAWTSRQLYKQI